MQVPQRMGAVVNHVIALGEMPPVEVIAVEILGETLRHINAKAIDASIAPKRQDVAKRTREPQGHDQSKSGCSGVNMCRYH